MRHDLATLAGKRHQPSQDSEFLGATKAFIGHNGGQSVEPLHKAEELLREARNCRRPLLAAIVETT